MRKFLGRKGIFLISCKPEAPFDIRVYEEDTMSKTNLVNMMLKTINSPNIFNGIKEHSLFDVIETKKELKPDIPGDVTENISDETKENSMSIEIENETETVEEVKLPKVRVLFKKCLLCSYIVPWEELVNDCIDDAECPAQFFTFVRGRDPKLLIETTAEKFSECLFKNDKEGFDDILIKLVKGKDTRPYVFDMFTLAISKLEEKQIKQQDTEVPI